MQAGEDGREHRGPDASTRLRLLSLQTACGPFEIGGGLACVHTPPAARRAIAEEIARAVIGPRAEGVDGTLEIAGRYVALHSLPSPLLRPSAAATIDRLDDLWRNMCAQQHAEVAAAHAARRLDRHRTEAAIERARERASRLASADRRPVATVPPPAPEPAPDPVVDDITPRLVSLLESLDGLQPIPSPDAHALATAFEALAASPPPEPEPIDVDLGELERRVADARGAVAGAAGGVSPAARTRIEQCHRAVVETERTLFEADRKERSGALARYQEALGAERDALSEAGVDSYASFLVAIAAGAAPVDLEERLRAELELAHAEAALDEARASLAEVADERHDAELELRARAAQLLGRFPGADPAAELRGVRIEHPDAARLRDELRSQLGSIGITAGADVVEHARATVIARQAAPPPVVVEPAPVAPPAPPIADQDDEELLAAEAEINALLDEGASHDAALAQMEAQLEALDGHRVVSFGDLNDVDAVALVLDAMLDLYRAAELLAGRLPIVVDGAFDELGAQRTAVAADHLAAANDVQVIVVTNDSDVAEAFSVVGAATSSWPPAVSSTPAPAVAPSQPGAPAPAGPPLESPIVPMCGEHADKVAASACSQCARPSCVDCLVYMPDTADLWCVTCAEATGRRDTRLLGRA